MDIEITQADIDNGRHNDPECCPVALAIRRQTPYPNAVVSRLGWSPDSYESELISFPKSVEMFITNFDNRRPVSPRTLMIPMPGEPDIHYT
jgi:hypothetical protein